MNQLTSKLLPFVIFFVLTSILKTVCSENLMNLSNYQPHIIQSNLSFPLRITFNNTSYRSTNEVEPTLKKKKFKRPTPRYINERTISDTAFPLQKIVRKITNGFGIGEWLPSTWTTDSALNHLQVLKDKLLSYYAKKSLDIGTGRDGIGFPSLEGALLSLAFLTFSVFLIDLVQTLLSRLRRAPVATINGRRRKRDIPDEDNNTTFSTLTTLVLSAIERPFMHENVTQYYKS